MSHFTRHISELSWIICAYPQLIRDTLCLSAPVRTSSASIRDFNREPSVSWFIRARHHHKHLIWPFYFYNSHKTTTFTLSTLISHIKPSHCPRILHPNLSHSCTFRTRRTRIMPHAYPLATSVLFVPKENSSIRALPPAHITRVRCFSPHVPSTSHSNDVVRLHLTSFSLPLSWRIESRHLATFIYPYLHRSNHTRPSDSIVSMVWALSTKISERRPSRYEQSESAWWLSEPHSRKM